MITLSRVWISILGITHLYRDSPVSRISDVKIDGGAVVLLATARSCRGPDLWHEKMLSEK